MIGKGTITVGDGKITATKETIRAGEGTITVDQNF